MKKSLNGWKVKIYNTPIELGIRASFILYSISPSEASINKIAYLDYMSIYSRNFTGIPSLHPEVPMHQMEFLLRFDNLKNGINYMIKKNIINANTTNAQIVFKKGENAFSFINLLDNSYYNELILRCKKVSEIFGHLNESELYQIILSTDKLAN